MSWSTFSDGRYKKNIKEDVKGLSFINNLRPITYTVDINSLNAYYDKGRKHDSAYEKMKADMQSSSNGADKIVYNGFVAQEVEAAAKKSNYDFSGVDKPQTKDGLYGLRYSDFVVPLVKAVQELSKNNDEKDGEINTLNDKVDKLQSQINVLMQKLNGGNSITQSAVNDVTIASTNARLEPNVPNPANGNTTIKYYVPSTSSKASIMITDMNGHILKSVVLSNKGAGEIIVSSTSFVPGNYFYSLIVDGKKIDSKQMILAK